MVGLQSKQAPEEPELLWIEADANPWGKRVLDIRPVTLTLVSTSRDPQMAQNAVSFGGEDGLEFVGQQPPSGRTVECSLRFPIAHLLADGVLFVPQQMEHKWAIFFHAKRIICVRSWLRQVQIVAHAEAHGDVLTVTEIQGTFLSEDEPPALTVRLLDFLLRSHALSAVYPAPIPAGMEEEPKAAAMWCFSMFGELAHFATSEELERDEPDSPLRTHSLLHLATARGDLPQIEASLDSGIPVDILAGDGLAPLHWALACDDLKALALLLKKSSPIDVRSDEGATPLMTAVQSGELRKVAFLLEHGADPNASDDRGFTSLHRAAELGHAELVRKLLDHGAAPHPEAAGHTPLSLAEAREEADIVSILKVY